MDLVNWVVAVWYVVWVCKISSTARLEGKVRARADRREGAPLILSLHPKICLAEISGRRARDPQPPHEWQANNLTCIILPTHSLVIRISHGATGSEFCMSKKSFVNFLCHQQHPQSARDRLGKTTTPRNARRTTARPSTGQEAENRDRDGGVIYR